MSMFSTAMFLETMENVCKNIHEWAKERGFWDEEERDRHSWQRKEDLPLERQGDLVKTRPWSFGEKIALVHSELSEALEVCRNELPTGMGPSGEVRKFKLNETQWWTDDGSVFLDRPESARENRELRPEGVGIELADAVIGIMDLAAKMDIDLGRAILDKMAYNRTRPKKHGKAY